VLVEPAVARLSTEVLREHASALTLLQHATLEAETLLTAPASEQLLSTSSLHVEAG
jgi:hypothetical protein